MPKSFLSENISNILSIARLAPSVHNSQPWRVKVDGQALIIEVEPSRQLTHGDPTGRQTYISLGIFAECCVLAIQHLGRQISRVETSDDGPIKILIGGRTTAKDEIAADLTAFKKRFTDRSVYKKAALNAKQMKTIEDAWPSGKVTLQVSVDLLVVQRCAELTRDGLLLALTSEGFRKELVDYLVPNSNTPQGIPLTTLPGSRVSNMMVRKLLATGLSRKHEARVEYERWGSASALVFVLAEGDSRQYWVESGRAYLRASLAISKQGLAQATSAAIVEASDFHEDIEKLLGTGRRIQCVIRIGKSSVKKRESGRLSPEQLLVT
jgi:hypothetical protein